MLKHFSNSLTCFLLAFLVHLACLLPAQVPGFTAVKDPETVKKQILEKQKQTRSVQSDFVQEKHLSFMKDKTVSKGTIVIKEGKKIRIDYTTPFNYLIVINEGKLVVKDGKKITRINLGSDKKFSDLNEILVRSMKGDLQNSKDFSAKYFENREHYLLELLPVNPAQGKFDKISIFFRKETLQVARFDMLEKSGDITKMMFENTRLNTSVSDEVFVVR